MVTVPWTDRQSHYTFMFEGIAVALLQHCSIIQAASKLLRHSWHATNDIMSRAVQRGLRRRNTDTVEHICIDEKSFRGSHKHATTLNDLKG